MTPYFRGYEGQELAKILRTYPAVFESRTTSIFGWKHNELSETVAILNISTRATSR